MGFRRNGSLLQPTSKGLWWNSNILSFLFRTKLCKCVNLANCIQGW